MWGSPPRRRGRRTTPIRVRTVVRLTPAQAGTARSRAASVRRERAHPRAGGDGRTLTMAGTWLPGSPPRRRGRPSVQRSQWHPLRAHPRAGGDGGSGTFHRTPAAGSPPRRRGRPGVDHASEAWLGLTPAQAGTAQPADTSRGSRRAHPRAGGDGVEWVRNGVECAGSPPRRRGRRRGPGQDRDFRGLTPAQAGTASRQLLPVLLQRAHPRAGGDGGCGLKVVHLYKGSPPRRRGRRPSLKTRPRLAGLTPAQAGTALSCPVRPSRYWAHPRAGGDGLTRTAPRTTRVGSPPRRRGRPSSRHRPLLLRGLTPAQAGTACWISWRTTQRRAHPRAGGDGALPDVLDGIDEGSPPRRRGRRSSRCSSRRRFGLTPAQAGTAAWRGHQP